MVASQAPPALPGGCTSLPGKSRRGSAPAADRSLISKRNKVTRLGGTIHALNHDILPMVFSLLDLFDVVRCSAVCKSWNRIINRSEILPALCCKHWGSTWHSNLSTCVETSFRKCMEDLVMKQHKLSMDRGKIDVYQWTAHSVGVYKCQMKMGLVLSGVGDKVMRLWSAESRRCLEEYSLSNMAPLVDFDFDESKIVGLIDTQLCIWRRSNGRCIFPSTGGTFPKGLCMRYLDPEAVVGCKDGSARIFDMYSRKCSQIIRMCAGPITCLSLGEDQLILGGSSAGRITIQGLSSGRQIASLRPTDSAGIQTLYYNNSSHLVFSGSTAGYASSWDLRTMRKLWETRVSPNVICSMQGFCNDTSTLIVGGIDGVLRIIDQQTGATLSSCVTTDDRKRRSSADMSMQMQPGSSQGSLGVTERREGIRVLRGTRIDNLPRSARPPITCLAVGMKKVVTMHDTKYIRLWNFNSPTN